MKFDWIEYFTIAQTLSSIAQEQSSPEAAFRSSISRAYYSVFCLSRNYLRDVEQDPVLKNAKNYPATNQHEYVAKELENHSNKILVEIGKNLSRLRKLRNSADYDDLMHNSQKDHQFALKLTEDIISKIKEVETKNH